MNLPIHKIQHQGCIAVYIMLLYSVLSIACSGQNNQHIKQDSATSASAFHDTIKIKDQSIGDKVRTVFPQIHTNLDGMVSEFVRAMYQDKNNDFWFGTNVNGVIRYNGKYLEKFTIKEGFGGTAVRGIAEDKEGNIWFGTSGGLTKYDGHKFINFSAEVGLIDDEIWGIEIDQLGTIWVGTNKGVSRFDGKVFTTFYMPQLMVDNPNAMLSDKRVSKIMEDRKGNLWFVTDGYGVVIYKDGKFTHITKKDGLADNNVADILEDKNGNIWMGTFYGGISRYDGKKYINYTKDGIIEGIETYNLWEDKNGNIWFAAENRGVYRYDGKSFTLFTTEDGLATDGIQSIYEDNKGQLWFGTWSGLSLYDGNSFFNAVEREGWVK